MAALTELREKVQPGMWVYLTNHDYSNDTSSAVVEEADGDALRMRLGTPRKSQGRSFTTSYLTWPVEGGYFEADPEYMVLRIYRAAKPRIGKPRVIALTLAFAEESASTSVHWCKVCGGHVFRLHQHGEGEPIRVGVAM